MYFALGGGGKMGNDHVIERMNSPSTQWALNE